MIVLVKNISTSVWNWNNLGIFLLVLIIHTHKIRRGHKLDNIYHDVIEKHDDAANDTPNSILAILWSILY